MPNAAFYQSAEWRALRLLVLRRDHWRCVLCSAPVWGKGKARVDHIRERTEAPHLARDPSNLRTLCATCDNQRHGDKGRAVRGDYGATVTGQPRERGHWWNEAQANTGKPSASQGHPNTSRNAHAIHANTRAPRGNR
jgi:hypothetical protein